MRGNSALGVPSKVCTTSVKLGGPAFVGAGGQISATVSAKSPTYSCDMANSAGSVRSSASWRISAGLAASKASSSVSAANPKPRSGSGCVEK